jgi:hypothetical protein
MILTLSLYVVDAIVSNAQGDHIYDADCLTLTGSDQCSVYSCFNGSKEKYELQEFIADFKNQLTTSEAKSYTKTRSACQSQ